MLRRLRRIFAYVAVGLAGLIVLFVSAIALQIRVELDPLREPFEVLASEYLGRAVELEGDFYLVPTWSLVVEAKGLRIANPEGWNGSEFAHLERAHFRFAVFPLLLRRLVVRELRTEGVDVRFERRADRSINWEFPKDETQAASKHPKPEAGEEPGAAAGASGTSESPLVSSPAERPRWYRLLPRAVVIRKLAMRDIHAQIHDAVQGITRRSSVEALDGTVATDAPITLSLAGTYHGQPFEASLETGDADILVTGEEAWPLEFVLEIPNAKITLTAQLDERSWDFGDAVRFYLDTTESPFAFLEHERLAAMTVAIETERLDALEPVFDVSLPPWGPLELEGHLEFFGGGGFSADVVTRVGSSELSGKLEIEIRTEPPAFDLALEAPTIQLDDFRLEGWSAIEGGRRAPPEHEEIQQRETARAMLDPNVLSRLDGRVRIDVGEVTSGRDRLGKGLMAAHVENGRFQLDALDLEIPGGSIRTRASLAPLGRSIVGSLDLAIDRFDYGVFARRFVAETDMRGQFSMKADLRSTASDLAHLVDHASGRFDVAVFPEELEAGVIDLWAVNLMAAVLPRTDSKAKSKINCVIALMDVRDGIMTENTLLADTSRMTVHGKAEIDLRRRWIELELRPEPKRPEFFSAATPIEVEGSFDAFDVNVDIDDMVGTLIRFVTSVAHVPLRRLFGHHEDSEDVDTCMAALHRR